MDKTARKKSTDPAQEHLRENKSMWNDEVSTLISRLISLKKVMNGKPDESLGIPPSSIKEPIAPQVSSALTNLQSDAGGVFNHAHSIIEEQAQYSTYRQKGKQAESLENLVKEASWFGSRLVSRFSRLGLDKAERILINRLIDNTVEQWDLLLKIEEIIGLYKTDEDISKIFTKINSALISYEALLKRFSKLYRLKKLKEQEGLSTDEEGKEQDKEIPFSPSNSVSLEQPESNFESTKPSQEESEVSFSKEEIDDKILAKFKKIQNNQDLISMILSMLSQAQDLSEEDRKKFLESKHFFNKNLNNLQRKIKKMTMQNSKEVLDEIKNFISLVDALMLQINDKKEHLAGYFQGIKDSGLMEKSAGITSPFKRWLGRNLLKLKTTDLAPMRLDVIESSHELRSAMDEFLNSLEDKNSSADELLQSLNKTRAKWMDLGNFVITLGQKYHKEERRQDRGKEFYKKDISAQDFSDLTKSLSKIQTYVP